MPISGSCITITANHLAARSAGLRRTATLPYLIVLSLLMLLIIGCSDSPLVGSPSTLEPFSQLDLGSVDQNEIGLNESFAAAEALPITLGEDFTISGVIEESNDVDIYDLGLVQTGDRVVAEVFSEDELEGAVTLFDGEGNSLLVNDSHNVYRGRLGPYVDLVLRRGGEHAYLAVSSTPGGGSTGGYTLAVRLTEGEDLPQPTPQTVLLNFAGAKGIGFGGREDSDIPPFSAGDISPEFAGSTDAMVRGIVSRIRADYQGLDVVVLSTSEGAKDDGDVSQLHFGAYDPALLGVAEGVDEYNGNTRQDAIVFTETFSAFNALDPTVEEMAIAIANVASHEIGHLLGLVHTSDAADIMDITASLSQLMIDQTFKTGLLHPSVFLIGAQDSRTYLLDSVGGNAAVLKTRALLALEKRAPIRARTAEEDVSREGLRFSTCCDQHHAPLD